MMVLIIDNYDSFTWNLVDLIRRHTSEFGVLRNDEINLEEIKAHPPKGILISPGPGRPEEVPILGKIIENFKGSLPILGVCLGHQAIVQHFGGKISKTKPFHGKTALINHDGLGLFQSVQQEISVMRYHSLIAERESFPDELDITAMTTEGEIMGIRHKIHNLAGLQFHPESILTAPGNRIIKNWLDSL